MRLKSLPGPPTIQFLILLLWHLIPFSLAAAVSSNSLNVTIPPLLEDGPPNGELLFSVIHDPEQEPENLTIPCRANALPTPSYAWFKDEHYFDTDTTDGVYMVNGEGTIVFKNPKPDDEGDYQCVATNAAGSVFSNVANVRRSITISFPKGDPRVVTVLLGDSATLKCDNPGGYPRPSLHWVLQKTDGSLRSVSSERATVDDEGTLWFSSVTQEDASDDSLYACAASSATSERQLFRVDEDGTMELRKEEPSEGEYTSLNIQTEYRMGNWVYLNVTVPHFMETGDKQVAPFEQHVSGDTLRVLKGDDLRIFCIYGGLPTPSVKWWREDDNEIHAENIVEFGKALEFDDLDQDIDGKYFCKATSKSGTAKTNSFNVIVESAPEFDVEPGTINRPIGESATFSCSAIGVPEPTISWSFNGEPLEQNSETYTLEDLTILDKGVIACNASNKHGYVYSTGFINVLILPPEFTLKPEDISSFIGDSVTFTCKGYGSPDPIIEWLKIDDDDKFERIQNNKDYELGDDTLTIKSLVASTAGSYECRAINRYGQVQTQAQVNIIKSTKVDLEISKENAQAGEDLTLRCSVSVDEELNAEVKWLKDEKSLDFSNSRLESRGDSNDDDDNYDRELVINNSKGSDSGTYYCLAKTERDENMAFVILTVEDEPEASHIADVECSAREAYIKWNPGSANNSPLLGYKVEMQTELDRDSWVEIKDDIPGSAESAKVALHPGLEHTFRVIAVNHIGESEPSVPSDACTAKSVSPDNNPENVKAETISSSSIKVMWDAIELIKHNGPEFHYEVKWRIHDDDRDDGDDSWSQIMIDDWEQTDAELDELNPYTHYEIKVIAGNEVGEASDSDGVIQVTEADVPEESPTSLEISEIKAKSAIFTWVPLEIEDVYGPLKGYEINFWKADEGEDRDDVLVEGRSSTFLFEDLEPFTEYSAKVKVVNDVHDGPFSETITFTTLEDASSPVTNLKGRSLSNSIVVDWGAPNKPNGILTNYVIKYQSLNPDNGNEQGSEEEVIIDVQNTQAKLSNLQQETMYEISVYAKNNAGMGGESKIEVQTEKVLPSKPAVPFFSLERVENQYKTNEEDDDTATKESVIVATKTITQSSVIGDRNGDGNIDDIDKSTKNIILKDVDGDNDIDSQDILDTDNSGKIEDEDFDVADINDDDVINVYDVSAADMDGDGDVDINDIGDVDGDGDFDADDVIAADKDGDGDIDLADQGKGVSVKVNWQPNVENNPGSEFYLKYRAVGHKYWRRSKTESNSLHQTLEGLDPYSPYEIQMIAKDEQFETPSAIKRLEAFQAEQPMEDSTEVTPMEVDPWLMTWFVVAIMVSFIMFIVIIFSVWVYRRRMMQVSELRAQLYEGYEPPAVVAKKGDLEASAPPAEVEEEEEQKAQMASLLRRQETAQSVDSFASHDDDFAEYGDETMGNTTFNDDGSFIFQNSGS